MENPVTGFSVDHNDKAVFCEAVMHDTYYDILFSGVWVAAVQLTENETWIQVSGTTLPQATIDEIGRRIESKYD